METHPTDEGMNGAPPSGFQGNHPRGTRELLAWLDREEEEEAVAPEMPIVDAHHHLFGAPEDRLFYRLDDLARDLDCSHRVVATVYVEAYEAGWRTAGPEALRPVGEVERIVGLARAPVRTGTGPCEVAAGIVGHADLALGDAVEEVLHALVGAGQGRLKGIRHRSAVTRPAPDTPASSHLADPAFRRGLARLDAHGLSLDVGIHQAELAELAAVADACPGTPIILNHMAVHLDVGGAEVDRAAILRAWAAGIRALARRPNVVLKVGGLGMPLVGLGFERRPRPAGAAEIAEAWRPYVETAVDAFGTGRCMVESNFPVDKQSTGYRTLWNVFKRVTQTWSEDERADVFFRTACRAYRLTETAARCERLLSAGRARPGPT